MANKLWSGDEFSSMSCGSIVNRVSINLIPFRIIRIYKYYTFSGSGRTDWGYASAGRFNFLRTNKSAISNQALTWNDTDDINVSSINEQVFIKLNNVSGPGYSGSANGGTMIITRIDFLT